MTRRTHWRIQPSAADLLVRGLFLAVVLALTLFGAAIERPRVSLDLTRTIHLSALPDEGNRARAFQAGQWETAP